MHQCCLEYTAEPCAKLPIDRPLRRFQPICLWRLSHAFPRQEKPRYYQCRSQPKPWPRTTITWRRLPIVFRCKETIWIGVETHIDRWQASSDSKAIFEKLKDNYLACMDVETVQEEAETGPRAIYDYIATLFPVASLNSTLTTGDSQAVVNLQVFLNSLEVDLFAQYRTSDGFGLSVSSCTNWKSRVVLLITILGRDSPSHQSTRGESGCAIPKSCAVEFDNPWSLLKRVSPACLTGFSKRSCKESSAAGRELVIYPDEYWGSCREYS